MRYPLWQLYQPWGDILHSPWFLYGSYGEQQFFSMKFQNKPDWSLLDPIMRTQNEIWRNTEALAAWNEYNQDVVCRMSMDVTQNWTVF